MPGRHVDGMVWNETRGRTRPPQDAAGPVIDMTPDGQFIDTGLRAASPIAARVLGLSVLVAVIAGILGVAMLALWLALQLIPIAIGAGLIAYGAFRFQLWRARHGSLRGQGNPLRR